LPGDAAHAGGSMRNSDNGVHARSRDRPWTLFFANRNTMNKRRNPYPHLAAVLLAVGAALGLPAQAAKLEKDELKLGFIKLTDMVPLAIAYEKRYFEDEGLYVTLEAQANWKVLLDRVISGELDGAHMLAGQPLAATIGFGTKAPVITAVGMGLNGNAITLANGIWEQVKAQVPVQDGQLQRPVRAGALKPVIQAYKARGESFRLGMVFPVSTHNYELRYWLAADGIHPGYYAPNRGDVSGQLQADVLISVTPPPQMPATLEAGTIHGYCVGEPWNQQAVFKGIGVPVITDYEIWQNNPEKVFGVREDWARQHPNTHKAVLKALIRAAYWLDQDQNRNRMEAVRIISRPHYVGADEKVIANSMTGTFEYEKGEKRAIPDFNVFFRHHASYPYYSDAIWYLTQMRRWGQIAESRPDAWYLETARQVYRPDLYAAAAKELIAEGRIPAEAFPDFARESGFKPETRAFIDGIPYDGRQPNAYLERLKIGLKRGEQP
jgi:nitrate/nitrite transport system substrate-binding protein